MMRTRQPGQEDINIVGVEMSNIPTNVARNEVRIRCIEETGLSHNAPSVSLESTQGAALPSFPVPYSVAIADKTATWQPGGVTLCEFLEHIPAPHVCGLKSVATVATLTRGMQRACAHHARASYRFGLAVLADAGYAVAE